MKNNSDLHIDFSAFATETKLSKIEISKKHWQIVRALFSFNKDCFGWVTPFWSPDTNYYAEPCDGEFDIEKGFCLFKEDDPIYDEMKGEIRDAKYLNNKDDFMYHCVFVPFLVYI